MAEKNCKLCLHKDVCQFRDSAEDDITCAEFKNKADYAEVKHGEWTMLPEVPQEDKRVLVCCQTKKGVKSVNIAYQSDGIWHGSGSMSGVIAWMRLPALP